MDRENWESTTRSEPGVSPLLAYSTAAALSYYSIRVLLHGCAIHELSDAESPERQRGGGVADLVRGLVSIYISKDSYNRPQPTALLYVLLCQGCSVLLDRAVEHPRHAASETLTTKAFSDRKRSFSREI